MHIRAIPASQLSPRHLDIWSQLQQSDPALDSPLFRPEFTMAVAAGCDNVEVSVLEETGEPAGFFPFQRLPGDVGMPVAGRLNDFHGVVARQGAGWTAPELIRSSGLSAWHFHNVLSCQEPFGPFSWAQAASPYIDISAGYEVYCKVLRERGSDEIRRIGQKKRKMERELGSLRFVTHTTDKQVFESLICWKLQQYERTKATNFLAGRWKIDLLQRLSRTEGVCFSGMLSALYAGDRLAAVHLGLRSGGVLHGWFPAYNFEYFNYSPGQILWQQIIEAGPSLGIRRIDLGCGEERFKSNLMSGAILGGEGSVDLRGVRKWARRSWFRTCHWIKASPLRDVARGVARNTRALLGHNK
jgi:CelD/BcsL family acetyltransferase involved in cellulose biosynthesis